MWLDKKSLKSIGQYLYDRRTKINKTQAAIAKKLGFESSQYVSNWERGLCPPPKEKLIVIAQEYEVPRSELAQLMSAESKASIKRLLKVK